MPDHDHEMPAEQEARLRRLLAQAREREPVPDDVAARLDRVLAQLAADGLDPHGHDANELAARRRRRVRTLLGAAAAVVVVGVTVGQLADTSGSDDLATSSDAPAAASAADSALADGAEGRTYADTEAAGAAEADAQAAPDAVQESGPDQAPSPDADRDRSQLAHTLSISPSPPVRLSETGFAAQAERYRDHAGTRSVEGTVVPGQSLSRAQGFVCDTAAWGTGRILPALYDGVPAVLAYRPVAGATQTVELLRCGTAEVLRSIVLPIDD